MKKLSFLLLLFVVFISCDQDDTVIFNPLNNDVDLSDCDVQAPIYENLSDDALIDSLLYCFTPQPGNVRTYSQARNLLYSEIDVFDGQLETIYTKYKVELAIDPNVPKSFIDLALEKGINCEHVFPQSQGASQEPARADMYHIYPEKANVNGARSFYPFGEINDSNVNKWYFEDQIVETTPQDSENWARGNSSMWEPSDDRKGDVARSVFYFALIYKDVMNQDYFNGMRETLLQWHENDPVDSREAIRSERVRSVQDNYNPFIIDEGLAQRVFGN